MDHWQLFTSDGLFDQVNSWSFYEACFTCYVWKNLSDRHLNLLFQHIYIHHHHRCHHHRCHPYHHHYHCHRYHWSLILVIVINDIIVNMIVIMTSTTLLPLWGCHWIWGFTLATNFICLFSGFSSDLQYALCGKLVDWHPFCINIWLLESSSNYTFSIQGLLYFLF